MMSPRGLAASALMFALAASVHAANSPVPTVVHVDVTDEVNVSFQLAGIDSVGFTHRQRTSKEKDAVAHVRENLQTADTWIRFNTEAQCRLSASSIGANIYRVIDPDAPPPHPPITKPTFEANYTFTCDAMPALRTLDLMFIERFPRVREVIVDVRTPASHHAEIVTAPMDTVSLTPK